MSFHTSNFKRRAFKKFGRVSSRREQNLRESSRVFSFFFFFVRIILLSLFSFRFPFLMAALRNSSPQQPNIMPRTKYKLVFLGDEGVGKTSIIARFMKDDFSQNYSVCFVLVFLLPQLSLSSLFLV